MKPPCVPVFVAIALSCACQARETADVPDVAADAGRSGNVEASDAGTPSPAEALEAGDRDAAASCGTAGSVDQRIADCARTICTAGEPTRAAIVDCSAAGAFVWRLVAKTERGHEVWLDDTARLMWSDDSVVSGDEPTLSTACSDSAQLVDSKGGISSEFRLPTKDEMSEAMAHRAVLVLRSFNDVDWWTSTPYDGDEVWYASEGELRHMSKTSFDEYFRARCVALVDLK